MQPVVTLNHSTRTRCEPESIGLCCLMMRGDRWDRRRVFGEPEPRGYGHSDADLLRMQCNLHFESHSLWVREITIRLGRAYYNEPAIGEYRGSKELSQSRESTISYVSRGARNEHSVLQLR